MSQPVNPYREQIASRGAADNQQNPDTADGGIGVAGRALGSALADFGRRQQSIEDDQGKMWAANASAQNEVAQQKRMAEHVDTLDPSAPDYVDKINQLPDQADQEYQSSVQQMMDNAPNNAARKYVTMHAAPGRVRMVQNAIGTSANLNASYAVSQVDQSVKSATDVVAGSPDNATFESINANHRQTIMGLTTIDPTTKLKLADQGTHALSIAQVQAVAAQNPTAFLQQVNAQGGVTTRNGGMKGGVPGGNAPAADAPTAPAQPEMLAFANAQLAATGDPEAAMKATTAKFSDKADQFAFGVAPDGKSFIDHGAVPGDPQVQPLDDNAIAGAKPAIAGWSNLTWPEKVSAVRAAEAATGKNLAEDRGALSRELKDANASLLSGQQYPGLNSPRFSQANLSRVFGDDVGARAAQELTYNAQVGDFVNKASVMPAAQRQSMLAQLKPVPGEGFAEKQSTYEMAQRAVAQVAKQQQDQPITAAIAGGINGAQPLDFTQPDTLATQLRNRTMVTATMVRDYGTKAQVFTPTEVDQLAEQLGNATGKARIATLANIRNGLNDPDAFSVAMNELAPKNPNLAYAANLAAKPGVAYVGGKPLSLTDVASSIADGDIILNGRSLDKQMAKGDDPSMPGGAKAVNFDDKGFRQQFRLTLAGAFRTADAQGSAAAEQGTYNVARAYYAAEAYKRGLDLSVADPKLVRESIEAVAGAPWQQGNGVLLAPIGMPVEQAQAQFTPRARAALTAAGYSADDTDRVLNKAVPVNLGDGVYGFQNGTRLQTDAKGRKVLVDYRQPYAAPANDSGPARAVVSPMMHRY